MGKNVAIVGLGLIGGSLAKGFAQRTKYDVIGIDTNESVTEKALNDGVIKKIGDENSLAEAEIIVLAIYPEEAVKFIRENGDKIKEGTVVIDVSGIKGYICAEMPKYAEKFGFIFVGCHPMAGKENGGYENSEAELFDGASFIITPCGDDSKVEMLIDLAKQLGFTKYPVTTPQEHDRMIAFTSQIPHILANAYVQSPCCMNHDGFSAGSYRDVSRVARLNEHLWAELFLRNRELLIGELDILISNITSISDAIKADDSEKLTELLARGRKVKEELGE